MVAPDRHVRLGDSRVGPEDEDRRMGGRQQAERELGLGADRVQAGRVEHDEALAQQRVRVVDQRMAPLGDLDAALVVERRIVFGTGVIPEAQGQRFVLADPAGAHHFGQRLRQLVGRADVELDAGPGARLRAQLAERQPFEPAHDGQQRQGRRFFGVVGEFHRAHRRAPRRGRQHAAAGVGKEDRVDQLRLAARELGDERDDQLFAGEPPRQRLQRFVRRTVGQLVFAEIVRELRQPLRQCGSPAAQGVEIAGEGRRHEWADVRFGNWFFCR